MNLKDIEMQAKYLAPVIKAAIESALAQIPRDPVPGPQGPAGEAGPQGPAGKDATVDTDALKAAILAELTVPEPTHGRDGRDGKDALDIEILPEIDPAKSYVRGTYASHNGGLWKSYERTHGMRGWDCIVDGVAGVEVTQTTERAFTVTTIRSSGASVEKSFTTPAVIYKEVYRSDETYEHGDAVTYNGSLWIATKGAPEGIPGTVDGWRLAVKSGRNGRDLRDNASTHDPKKALKI